MSGFFMSVIQRVLLIGFLLFCSTILLAQSGSKMSYFEFSPNKVNEIYQQNKSDTLALRKKLKMFLDSYSVIEKEEEYYARLKVYYDDDVELITRYSLTRHCDRTNDNNWCFITFPLNMLDSLINSNEINSLSIRQYDILVPDIEGPFIDIPEFSASRKYTFIEGIIILHNTPHDEKHVNNLQLIPCDYIDTILPKELDTLRLVCDDSIMFVFTVYKTGNYYLEVIIKRDTIDTVFKSDFFHLDVNDEKSRFRFTIYENSQKIKCEELE